MRSSVLHSLKTHAEGREGRRASTLTPANSWPVPHCLLYEKAILATEACPGRRPCEAEQSPTRPGWGSKQADRQDSASDRQDGASGHGLLAPQRHPCGATFVKGQRRFSVPRVADLRSLGRKPFERASLRGPFRATAVTAQPPYNAFPKRPEASTPK